MEEKPNAQPACENESFFEKEKPLVKQKLNFSGSALFLMETTVSLNYFLNYSLSKQFLASNLP